VIDRGALGLVAVDLLLVLALTVLPLWRSSADDQGDGFSRVVLPTPAKRNLARVMVLFGVFAVMSFVYIALRRPGIEDWYRTAVERIAAIGVHDPRALDPIISHVDFGVRFVAVAYLVGLAVAIRAQPLRRLLVLANAAWTVALLVLTDAAVVVVAALNGWTLGPFALARTGAALLVVFLIEARVFFTTFQLPRPSAVPILRHSRPPETGVTLAVIAAALACSVVLGLVASQSDAHQHLLLIVAGYAVFPAFFLGGRLLLGLLYLLFHRLPEVGEDRPAIDVIIPAYNENPGLGDTLWSIDRAAEAYGGPVRVIVSNDGSTDGTGELANSIISRFRSATGIVLNSGHRGKAFALNTALAEAGTDMVIRIDADVVLHDQAIMFASSWCTDPWVGSVSAMTLPRHQDSWCAHIRTFECMFEFGLARRGDQMIDAIHCVPGTFTAFRRVPTIACGGFAMGMNGEDSDLTMQLGRLGYQIAIDPRIRIFEDVPRNLAEFREQRTRWSRGGAHVFARHAPFRAGMAGPRTWFSLFRIFSRRFTSQLRVPLLLFALEALLVSSYRHNIVLLLLLNALLSVPILALFALLAVLLGQADQLRWLPQYFPFQMARRLATYEATLSLPCRPVRGWRLEPAPVLPEPDAVAATVG
jgi:cellulose synthase/poly-beta-1,6-N-acetylglucosamine synthase-like glycosyltransferase